MVACKDFFFMCPGTMFSCGNFLVSIKEALHGVEVFSMTVMVLLNQINVLLQSGEKILGFLVHLV